MLGKRFQRTTSMAHIGTPNNGKSAAAAEEHPPSSEQQPISQWELLKHADEMMKMMMAAAGGGNGGQVDITATTAATKNSRGGRGEAGIQHFDRPSSELIPRVDFLDNCFFCKRRLKHERDIFIYGGDAAFCTEECRQRQILKDESRAIVANKAKKGGSAVNTETAVAA